MTHSTGPNYAEESPELEGYRALSPLAVGAFLIGLLSFTILFNPLMVGACLLGLVVSLVALRRISRADSQLSGAGFALAGLVLASLFLGWGLTANLYRRQVVAGLAEEVAQDFLRLVAQNKLPLAHQLTISSTKRLVNIAEVAEAYHSGSELATQAETFFRLPEFQDLIASHGQAKLTCGVAQQLTEGASDRCLIQCRVSLPSRPEYTLFVIVRRVGPPNLYDYKGSLPEPFWQVENALTSAESFK